MVLEASSSAVDSPPGEVRQIMFDSIKCNANKVFMIDGLTGTEVSYQELFEKAVSVAIFLNKSGIGDGSHVGILSDVLIESNIFLVAVWLSGATLCPMNPSLKEAEIRQLVEISKAKFFFCQEKYLMLLEAALGETVDDVTIVTDVAHDAYIDLKDMMAEDPSEFEIGIYDPEESLSHILFTSGTTGLPKGVMCNSRSSKTTAFRLRMKRLGFVCTSPLYWISYIAVVVWTLVNGSTLIVPRKKYIPGTDEEDITHILDCIQKYQPYNWFAGPSLLLELCATPSSSTYDLSSLGRVGVGGSQLLSSQRRQICDTLFNGRNILFNMYGATEVGVITEWPEGDGPDHDSPVAGSVGMLAAGVSLKVVDVETGAELGPNMIGEFLVKSDAIMKGYINEDMPERYTPDDWYRMGDLGYYNEDGYLFFSSRLKETIKYRGTQIAPAELEKVIILHPNVQEVCVVGRPHTIDGERPAAFVVPKDDSLSEEELTIFVNEKVADVKKLRGGVIFVDSIPKSGVGKILRRDLLKLFESMDSK